MISIDAAADEWVIRPAAKLEQRYDDNYRLSISSPDEVYTTRVAVESKLSRLTERAEADGLVRFDFIRYSGDTEELEDENNQLLHFSSLYRTSELNRLSIAGTYKRDTLLRTVEIIVDPEDVTIEPDDDVDDAIVRENVRRERFILRPGWRRNLTERSGIELDYRFNGVTFENEERTDLRDYSENTIVGGLFQRITEKDRFSTSLAARLFRVPDDDRKDISYALLAGVIHEFSETETGSFRFGLRRTEFTTGSERSDDDGFLLRVFGSKRTGVTTFSGKLEHRLAPSGAGEQVEKTEASFNISRRLSQFWRFTFRSRLYETETLRVDDPNTTRRYLQYEPGLRWRLSRRWSMQGGYRYRRRKIDGDPASSESNVVFVSLNYAQPTPLN